MPTSPPIVKFDHTTWHRFVSVAKPFFFSDVKWKAWGLLLLLATFSVSVSSLNVLMSYVGRDFMTALSLKEKDEFIRQLLRYLLAFAGATPVVVFYRYTEERLGLLWRKWLSQLIIKKYFTSQAYYKINWYGGIDNPDQRIEEDIRSFTSTSLSFLLIIFNSLIALVAFVGILWSISAWLVIGVVAYAIFGSIVTYFLGRPLIALNFTQLKKEADYRYKLIKIRDNAEAIAFYKGEKSENTRVRQRLKDALQNLLRIVNWNRNLNFFTTGYNYLVTLLPTMIVAHLYLDGQIEFGVVSQAGFAFGHVLNALSIIVTNFGGLSSLAAVVTRLGTFWETLDEVHESECSNTSCILRTQGDGITLEEVTIVTPNKDQVLIKDLSVNLGEKSLLVVGPSGSGKSSLLRVIAGVWKRGVGKIICPPFRECIFLPQRPYLILGTLRAQLIYGVERKGFLDQELYDVIKQVGLEDMFDRVGGFEAQLDWQNVLATGEQQRLALARLVLAKPNYAFLDEATTALDSKSEEDFYKQVQGVVKTYVSVGDYSALAKFHDYVLRLKGNGSWELLEAA